MRKPRIATPVLCLMLCLVMSAASSGVAAQSALLKQDYPASYIVQEGDSLWEIASVFLQDPERWPEIWRPDPYLDNSDLIYPGDTLSINVVRGSPRIAINRGGRDVENLGPQIRAESLQSAIPAIPLESIENSFSRNRIVDQALYDSAPYIVQNIGDALAIATGDEVYARGNWPSGTTSFEVYRPSREYENPDNEDLPYIEIEYLGFASITSSSPDGIRRLLINNSSKEIRVGDRLLTREVERIGATIFPSEPVSDVEGRVLSILNTEAMASQLDTVVINLGLDDRLAVGDILAVRKEDSSLIDGVERDRMTFRQRVRAIFSGERLNLPGSDIGTLLVYKTFDQFCYALVLSSREPIGLDYRVTNP